jgi:hypothetical protein
LVSIKHKEISLNRKERWKVSSSSMLVLVVVVVVVEGSLVVLLNY